MRRHQPAHQCNVCDGRAAGAEAGGSFNEVGASGNTEFACASFFSVSEQTGFKYDFANGTGFPADLCDGLDVGENDIGVAGFQRADVKNYVNFACAIAECGAGFGDFGLGKVGSERKTDYGADFDRRVLQKRGGLPDVKWVDTDRTKLVLRGFPAKPLDVSGSGVGFEKCVVDNAGDVHGNFECSAVVDLLI